MLKESSTSLNAVICITWELAIICNNEDHRSRRTAQEEQLLFFSLTLVA